LVATGLAGMVDAGKMRERVTFQRQGAIDDGYGNTRGDWADHLTVWADVLERLGGEKIASGAVEASRLATIRVRRSSQSMGVTEADRVLARGIPWNIRSIAAVGRKDELLEVLCEAGVAA